MKRSLKLKLAATLFAVAGLVLGLVWFIVCTALGVGLLMNGVWLIALLLTLAGGLFAVSSIRQEDRESQGASK